MALTSGDTDTAADALAVAAAERRRLGIAPWPTLEPAIDRVARAVARRIEPVESVERHRPVGSEDVFASVHRVIHRLRGHFPDG